MDENRNADTQGKGDPEQNPGKDPAHRTESGNRRGGSERVTNRESGGDRGAGRASNEGHEGLEDGN